MACSLLLMALVASLAFFKTQHKGPVSNSLDPQPGEHQPDLVMPEDRSEPSARSQVPYLPNRPSVGAKGESTAQPDTSPIESILQDKARSFEESATRLLECARRKDLPMEVRLSALDHAFNLDHWQALILCMEKPLPTPIAERLLSGIHNLNESPKDQVSACMHLIEHEDAGIREQAQGLLAFLVSAEEHATEPDKLREAANVFLKRPDEGGEEVSGQ